MVKRYIQSKLGDRNLSFSYLTFYNEVVNILSFVIFGLMAFIGYSKGPIIFKLETKLNAVLK